MLEALKALSTFFTDNSLRSRRNLRGDIEKRSLAINEQFETAFRQVKLVRYLMIETLKMCTEPFQRVAIDPSPAKVQNTSLQPGHPNY